MKISREQLRNAAAEGIITAGRGRIRVWLWNAAIQAERGASIQRVNQGAVSQ